MSSRKELGKGIRALLNQMDDSPVNIPAKKEVVQELSQTILEIPVEQIEANPFQPRQEFDAQQLEELAASIKMHGLIQPITVRRLSAKEYQLISGERRWRAAQKAGLKTIPAYIRLADDQGLLEMALIENIQRADLNAIEVAISYQRLMDECSLTHESLSTRVGKDRSTVTNYLRVLKLPVSVQQAVRDQTISMGHARVIAGVDDAAMQLHLLGEIMKKHLSVRATEQFVQEKRSQKATGAVSTKQSAQIQRMEKDLSAFLGTKVRIQRAASGKGKITIPFNSDDELNDILDRFE